MQFTALRRELGKSRWSMDLFVSSFAATGFYLYIVWLTLMFETSPPDPIRLIKKTIIIVFGYAVSMFLGRMFLKDRLSSFVWVSSVGSAIFAVTWLALSLPSTIEYYNRFTPDSSLARYLIRDKVPPFFGITLSFTVVTMIAALVARVVRLIFVTRLDPR